MHTPAGFELIDGRAHATDWLAIVLNPSFPYRLVHTLLASGLTAAFLISGLSAYRWLIGSRDASVTAGMRTGLWLAAILVPVQIIAGDLHGLNTLEHQPAKVAAMEGLWETQRGAPLVVFGLPDEEARTNRMAIEVPKLASLILTHRLEGELKGLNEFEGEHPPVAAVFWSFRIMVATGIAMLLVAWITLWKLRKGRQPSPTTTRVLVGMTFSGWIGVLSGWYTTEIGRQPFLVNGVLKTSEALGPVAAGAVMTTLVAWLLLYAFLVIAYIKVLFYLAGKADLSHKQASSPVEAKGDISSARGARVTANKPVSVGA
jgi:cytochrome d ubiquinol oxidase subunit I